MAAHAKARSYRRLQYGRATPRVIVPSLLDWFAANARDLPWRRTRDPYAIWISEIMLQQTQVKTVIPYWERWLRELPTIKSLANAGPEKIHKLWEGLGYYTRVRNMQKAARQICTEHGGRFPDQFDAILALPGIGRYTAGAIASIAFNQPAPVLDGNVIRVLTRLHGIGEDPREKQTNARLWQLAGELVSHTKIASTAKPNGPLRPSRPWREIFSCSALNQSLMELGALICTPRSPNCPGCPIAKHCVAFRDGRVAEFPRPKPRTAITERRFITFVIERDGRFLVRQRSADVVNGHLWEFPNIEVPAIATGPHHSVHAALLAWANGAQNSGAPRQAGDFQLLSTKPLCTIKHSITRYRMIAEVYRLGLPGTHRKLGGIWHTLERLHQLPFTSAHRQIATRLEKSLPSA